MNTEEPKAELGDWLMLIFIGALLALWLWLTWEPTPTGIL